jgi:hypothetical protein
MAEGDAPKPPSDDFINAACDNGLLVQRDDKAAPGAKADDDQPVDGLDDDSAAPDADAAPAADGTKPDKTPKPKKKPKTRLLKPKPGKRADCNQEMAAFYSGAAARGDRAILAPRDVPPDQLRAHADDVFAAMSPASKKGERLADLGALSHQDVDSRVAFANKLFEGSGPLDKVDFTALTAKASGLSQGMTAADKATKTAGLLGTSATAPDIGGAAHLPVGAAAVPPDAARDAYTAAPGYGLPGGTRRAASVPPVRAVPPAKETWSGSDYATPPPSGYVRQKINDYGAVANDLYQNFRHPPITTEEGWAPGVINPGIHNTTPAQLTGVAGVNAMLPAGLTGQSRECGRTASGNADYACWGTKDMISVLTSMGQKYDAYFKNLGGDKKIRIGDISKQGGGYLAGHVSHQRGVDVDLRFVGDRSGFNVQANSMVIAALMLSVPSFHHIPGQEMVLVDQSLHASVRAGLAKLVAEGVITADEAKRGGDALTHWPNHRDHFHVRIKLGEVVTAPQEQGRTPAADQESD